MWLQPDHVPRDGTIRLIFVLFVLPGVAKNAHNTATKAQQL
jgi:hypothetical protein